MKRRFKIVDITGLSKETRAVLVDRQLKALSGTCFVCDTHLDLTKEEGIWAGKEHGAVHVACWESLPGLPDTQ